MNAWILAAAAILASGAARADGTHMSSGMAGHMAGHDAPAAMPMGDHAALAIGEPAAAEPTSRTVEISMTETPDGAMVFSPARLDFRSGETVRLVIRNDGAQEHEFVMDTPAEIQDHKAMMAAMPDMVHSAPNTLRLQPGTRGEITWTFGAPGRFEFACLLLGHYEAGMHGPLRVN